MNTSSIYFSRWETSCVAQNPKVADGFLLLSVKPNLNKILWLVKRNVQYIVVCELQGPTGSWDWKPLWFLAEAARTGAESQRFH